MLLSYHDIERIQKLGYELSFFIEEHTGWLQLKNSSGRCVFHNGEMCTIYQYRPLGCALYPIVFEKDRQCAMIDKDCPQGHCFSLVQPKIQQLQELIKRLYNERTERKKK